MVNLLNHIKDPLVIGTLIIIGTALVSLIDKWKNKRSTGYVKNNLVAVTLFFIGIGGAYLSYDSGIKARAEKVLSDSVSNRNDSLYTTAQDSIIRLNRQLKDSASVIILNNRAIATNLL